MDEHLGERPAFDRLAAVERLCREARRHAKDGERQLALAAYLEAWELLPEPKASWDSSTLILSALGDLLHASGGDELEVLLRLQGRTAWAGASR
ncbi:MAG TPA: hypothetical protein VEB43_12770 [Anaeromyxobacter sp.]|nr:hypothetical protein [Anaeromyxobacter sp.]